MTGDSHALLVCESRPCWSLHLEARFLDRRIPVHPCESLDAAAKQLRETPLSLLVICWRIAPLEAILSFLSRLPGHFPDAKAILAIARGKQQLGWLLREAGAIHVVHSLREINTVCRLAERYAAGIGQAPRDLSEKMLDRLPWREPTPSTLVRATRSS